MLKESFKLCAEVLEAADCIKAYDAYLMSQFQGLTTPYEPEASQKNL